MKKTLLIACLLFLAGSQASQGQIYPDKCVCANAVNLTNTHPELKSDTSAATWMQYWDCPEIANFTIKKLMETCLTAYSNSGQSLENIIDTSTWDAQSIMDLEDLSAAADLTLTQDCYDEIGCGSGGTSGSPEIVKKVTVYPQPADNKLHIGSGSEAVSAVDMYDMQGRKQVVETTLQNGFLVINTTNLGTGIYVCRVYAADKVYSVKVMVQH